jgi:SLT domain-containing protein
LAEGFRIATAYVQVSPDTDGFAEELQEKLDEATAGVKANVKVGLDAEELDDELDEVKGKLDELDGKHVAPNVGLEAGEFDSVHDDVSAKLDALDGSHVEPTVGLDADEFDAVHDDVDARLDDLDMRHADPSVGLNDDEFNEKLAQDRSKLAAFNSEQGEGSLVGAIGMGVGSLLPGIGGAAAGLGLLGGVGALAFGGIAKALEAAHQSSENVGMTGAQLAAQEYSNAVAIQQAQETISQAHQEAAQNAIQSAQAIESAEMNLASTERNAAAAQVQALQQVQQSQQGVQEAGYNLGEAQYQLGQAFVQATQQIVNANNALADAKLSVQSATLAVSQAEYQQLLVDQNAYSTDLDREQAALAVAQAKQQVKDATAAESQAQTAANLADKQGVDGSQTVVQAKEAVKQATYGMTDAQVAYVDAQRNLTLTELNNAEQVKQAQMQVAQAQEQAAYQQRMDAEQVSVAEKNLTDTIREQQLQMASMLSTSDQAANQFALYMSKLTPAGRAFVNQVLAMSGAFKGLETAAQNAVLPGVTKWLHGLQGLLPVISKGVTGMGTAMGNAFGQFGKQMATPGFAKVLNGLIDNGIQFANIVLPAFAQFAQELAVIGSKSGAVSGLANLLAGIGRGLTGLAASVGRYTPQINSFLTAVGHIIAAIGPPLGTIIGLVARALGPLTTYLDKHPNGTVVKVIGDIVAGLLVFKGLQKLLPDFISGPLSKFASKGGEMLMKPFKDAAGQVPGLLNKAWTGVNQGYLRVFGEGGLVSQGWSKLFGEGGIIPSAWTKVFGEGGLVQTGWANVTSWGSTFATNVGSWMSQAAGSVVTFATTLGSRLAGAAAATWTWIAENTVAGASYIAENVAMAASATAAFIAENAATLGLGTVIAGLVAAIVYVATHWHQSWDDIKTVALGAWHDAIQPVFNGIETGAMFLWHEAIEPAFDGIKTAIGGLETAALWLWHNVFDPVWHGIEQGAQRFVTGFGIVWGKVESVFRTPVNFLIGTVYDKGIARFWNDVVGAVGLGSLKLPIIPMLAGGGMIPGYSPGHDSRIAAVSPGEGILTPQATQAIGGKTAIDSLNRQYPPSSSRPSSGDALGSMITKLPEHQLRRHLAERPAEHVLTAGKFAAGGVVGSAISGAWDIGKAIVALTTGNSTAFVNALAPMIGTSASGALGRVLVALPKTLMGDAAKAVMGMFSGGAGNSFGTNVPAGATFKGIPIPGAGLTAQVRSWFTAAAKATGAPLSWIPSLEEIAQHESGYDPDAVNNTPAGIAAGTPEGIMQTIMSTFLGYHQPGTSMDIFNPIANIASAIRYIRAVYRTPDETPGLVSVAGGGPYTGYDAGGWLMPHGRPVNNTGQPEAVLTPEESAAFVELAKRLVAQQGGAGLGPTIINNWNGPQMPSQEQLAIIDRRMAFTLSLPCSSTL